MTVLGFDHVSLSGPLGRESEVVPFYSEVMGFTEVEVPEALAGRGIHWFSLGPSTLHVIPEAEVAPSVRHPAILVGDLAPLRVRLEAAEIEIKSEPQLPGCDRFSFVDPFGNRVEVLQRNSSYSAPM